MYSNCMVGVCRLDEIGYVHYKPKQALLGEGLGCIAGLTLPSAETICIFLNCGWCFITHDQLRNVTVISVL